MNATDLPEWARSIRVRLTLLYSAVLFGIAALVVAAIYVALSFQLRGEPLTRQLQVRGFVQMPDGSVATTDQFVIADARAVERAVNERTLDRLATFSFGALGVLFVTSLGVGYVISGRVLEPIGRITDVARRIQASDLSRRIELQGPDDELKRLADTFDSMLERLDDAFAAQRRFIADASHELRNPLAIVRTNLDIALSNDKDDPAELRRAAEVARRAGDRMARMVDDLLLLARQESVDRPREEIDVGHVADEVADDFEAAARSRGVRLTRSCNDGLVVLGDPDAVRRALANLLDNAVRVSSEGGEVVIGTGSAGDWVWAAVGDEGPGIAPEDQEKIFRRFWRADEGRSRDAGGTGLGLAIVDRIVSSHGGNVRLASRVGEGSTFLIWLPRAGASGTRPPETPPQLVRDTPRLV
ncbi:MAG TPA: HAMP domain-containing sensor histidine kinase [Actinomycetota bacterium]|nr:HAMP domain-containing sensor histidine kinase [Actinomycetota bacterium]